MEICSAKDHEDEIGMAVINGCSVREPLGRNALESVLYFEGLEGPVTVKIPFHTF